MKKLLALLALLLVGPATAQTPTTPAIVALVCAYNSSVPVPVSGQFFYVQCDSNGNIITSGAAPSGAAGGALAGTYPNPTLANPILWTKGSSVSVPGLALITEPTTGFDASATTGGNLYMILRGSIIGVVGGNGFLQGIGGLSLGGSASAANTFLTGPSAGVMGLGGSTSSFPAIKRNATAVNIRLADDSADAPFTAGNGTFSGSTVILSGIGNDGGFTDATLCRKSSDGTVAFGSGALGICLGTSGRQFKTGFTPMQAGLDEVLKINLWNYRYKPGFGDGGERLQYGPTAQDIEAVLPGLVGRNEKGEAINYDWGSLIPIMLHAIQQQQAQINELKSRKER